MINAPLERAFPGENDADKTYNWVQRGMTLRDYFAGKALAFSLEQTLSSGSCPAIDGLEINPEMAAKVAYMIADAMLEERK